MDDRRNIDASSIKLPGNAAVILPCAPDQFADFIGGLLGKPQVIERTFSEPVDIRFSDVHQLYHLIDQRLTEQNRAQILQFNATFHYSDRSSVSINGYEEFKSYAEIKDVETMGLTCSFEYLIKFRNVGHSEKQTIDVTFARPDQNEKLAAFTRVFLSELIEKYESSVAFTIKHTARSWGADMEALLSSHVQGLVRKETPTRKFTIRFANWIGVFCGLCGVAISIAASSALSDYMRSQHFRDTARVLASIKDGISAAKNGIPLLIRQNTEQWNLAGQSQELLALMIGIFISVFISIYLISTFKAPYPTFLTFTKADERRKAVVSKQFERSRWYSIGATIVAILCGVASNFLFYLLNHSH